MYKTPNKSTPIKTNQPKTNKPIQKERSNKGVFTFLTIIIILIVGVLIYYFITTTKTGTEPEPVIPQYYFTYKEKYNVVPDFTNYDEDTFGVNKYSWDTDSNGLKECSKFFINSCRWADDNTQETTLKFMTNWGNFIEAVYNELEKTYYDEDVLQVIPWGEDWKPFGFEFTLCCCYYVLHKYANSGQKMIAATVSNKIIRSPKNIMANTDLKDFEIMELCFQYAVGRKHTRTFDPKNEDYLYGISYYILKYDSNNEYTEKRNGIQIDGSYMYNNEITFKYLPYLLENWYEMKQITDIYNVPVGIDLLNSKFLSKTFEYSHVPQIWHSNPTFEVGLYSGERKSNDIDIFPYAGICFIRNDKFTITNNIFYKSKIMATVTEQTTQMGSQYLCNHNVYRHKDFPEIEYPSLGYTKILDYPPEIFPIGYINEESVPENSLMKFFVKYTCLFTDYTDIVFSSLSYMYDNSSPYELKIQTLYDIKNNIYYRMFNGIQIRSGSEYEILLYDKSKLIIKTGEMIREKIDLTSFTSQHDVFDLFVGDYSLLTDVPYYDFVKDKGYVTYKDIPAFFVNFDLNQLYNRNIIVDDYTFTFDILLNQWVTQEYLENR